MEIPKFRVWLKQEEKMIEPDDISSIVYENKEVIVQEIYYSDGLPIDRDLYLYDFGEIELMKATGLFDKNGTEIFEGDIIADVDESGDGLVYLYVIYKDGKFIAVENEERGYSADLVDCTTYHSVVGNIYENAELLGQ